MTTDLTVIASTPPTAVSEPHPVLAYMAKLAPSSRRTMRYALDLIAGYASGGRDDCLSFEWHRLRAEHTEAIRAWLASSHLAPSTANLALTGLRQVLLRCRRRRLIPADEYEDAVDLDPIAGQRLPTGRALTAGELTALFAACDASTLAGARDGAIFGLGFGAGLRRSELVGVDLQDVDADPASVRVQKGKGNKGREVPLPAGAIAAVLAWVDARGAWSGPLFVPLTRGDTIYGRARLSDQAVFDVCRKRATQAGVRPFAPHDMRRTYISALLEAGGDLAMVQRLAGHADPGTTSSYDRRPEQAKRRTAELLVIPFSC
jgi:integrase